MTVSVSLIFVVAVAVDEVELVELVLVVEVVDVDELLVVDESRNVSYLNE